MLAAVFTTRACAMAGNWLAFERPARMSFVPVKMTYKEPGKEAGEGKIGVVLEEAPPLA